MSDVRVRPRSRSDEVVDGIRRMILDGELVPGSRLPVEKDLADLLGVSRGSLREGVRALAILGVLETRQGDGTYVTSLGPSMLFAPVGLAVELQGETGGAESFHVVRRILETEAAAMAASTMGPEMLEHARQALDEATEVLGRAPVDHELLMGCDIAFHRAIAMGSGNPVLAALVESLASRTVRGRLWRGLSDEGALQRTHAEHGAILAALEARDPERARVRMAVHLLEVEDFMRSRDAVPDGQHPHEQVDRNGDPDDVPASAGRAEAQG
ncbi:FadR/GntR family transcriptional regulator [Cellulomonas sp. ATA003]|uniref:FadR/GntR family transcriptional regulator n=1 Tax=Cellulomonas sp. ATA003 TaxID=3073064 RepID=UPI0028738AA2|nr:FadR/GntR family transcriptional regulator [Cellulomonas sp. ATA003]WNB86177.1 FadR/GntR family transcriptional regulator [Cellulomonas sp. ATA003]